MSNLLRTAMMMAVAGAVPPAPSGITISRTLDRTFTDTPASGGGNVSPSTFVVDGVNWELWQVLPFVGSGVANTNRARGDCQVQLRNRDIGRGQNTLEMMPSRIILTHDSWTGSPWEFNRGTGGSAITNVGSGNGARVGVTYLPVHTPGISPASVGVQQGQTFTIELFFD